MKHWYERREDWRPIMSIPSNLPIAMSPPLVCSSASNDWIRTRFVALHCICFRLCGPVIDVTFPSLELTTNRLSYRSKGFVNITASDIEHPGNLELNMSLLADTPLSLYSIPIVWYVGMWPARKRVSSVPSAIVASVNRYFWLADWTHQSSDWFQQVCAHFRWNEMVEIYPFSKQPRGNLSRLDEYPGASLDEIEAAERMEGAHMVCRFTVGSAILLLMHPQNSIEILPLWIGAVVCQQTLPEFHAFLKFLR